MPENQTENHLIGDAHVSSLPTSAEVASRFGAQESVFFSSEPNDSEDELGLRMFVQHSQTPCPQERSLHPGGANFSSVASIPERNLILDSETRLGLLS